MSTLVKIHRKGQMTLPTRLRTQAGISEGDLLEAAFHRGKIVLTPTLAIDRSKFSNADDEYTPQQRRIVDTRLAESAEDLKRGRTFGPFNTADEMIASMKAQLKKRSLSRKPKRSREG
jgi:AbrB family looped-hinge helix DNA binding protein